MKPKQQLTTALETLQLKQENHTLLKKKTKYGSFIYIIGNQRYQNEYIFWYLSILGIICLIVGGVMMFISKKESIISSIIPVITGILFFFIWYFVVKL